MRAWKGWCKKCSMHRSLAHHRGIERTGWPSFAALHDNSIFWLLIPSYDLPNCKLKFWSVACYLNGEKLLHYTVFSLLSSRRWTLFGHMAFGYKKIDQTIFQDSETQCTSMKSTLAVCKVRIHVIGPLGPNSIFIPAPSRVLSYFWFIRSIFCSFHIHMLDMHKFHHNFECSRPRCNCGMANEDN